MNVLIFVMTMLMLLSLMTYTRLETYRNSQSFQTIFKHYMQEDERGYGNKKAETTYTSIKVTEKETDQKKPKPPKKIDASPRVTVTLLFNEKREEKSKEWEQTKLLLKNLMRNLYEKQPFYKKVEKDRPNFIDELIRGMTQAIDELPKEKKPKNISDLANLRLADPVLDRVLYKMLHGAHYTQPLVEAQQNLTPINYNLQELPNEAEIETAADEEEAVVDGDEYNSSEGYYSLFDFISGGAKPKIRVYLAPKEVLEAIFKDPSTVESIIQERQRLYQQAVSDVDTDQLSETFKNQFLRMKDSAIEDETLNFSVTKTNPKNYK